MFLPFGQVTSQAVTCPQVKAACRKRSSAGTSRGQSRVTKGAASSLVKHGSRGKETRRPAQMAGLLLIALRMAAAHGLQPHGRPAAAPAHLLRQASSGSSLNDGAGLAPKPLFPPHKLPQHGPRGGSPPPVLSPALIREGWHEHHSGKDAACLPAAISAAHPTPEFPD